MPLPLDLEPFSLPQPPSAPPCFTFSDSDSDEECLENRGRFHDDLEEMQRACGATAKGNLALKNFLRNAGRKIRQEKAELERLGADSHVIRARIQELRGQFVMTAKVIEANANAFDAERIKTEEAHQAVAAHAEGARPDFTPFAKKPVKKVEKTQKPQESANAKHLDSRLIDVGLDTISMLPFVGVPVPPEISGCKKLFKNLKEGETAPKPFIQKLVCDVSIDTLKETINVTTAVAAGKAVGISTIIAPPLRCNTLRWNLHCHV